MFRCECAFNIFAGFHLTLLETGTTGTPNKPDLAISKGHYGILLPTRGFRVAPKQQRYCMMLLDLLDSAISTHSGSLGKSN